MSLNNILSFIYALLRFGLGLLLHPYQTMQMLVEDKFFVWLTLLPSIFLATLTVFWKIIIFPLISIIIPQAFYQSLRFFSLWVTLFCLYWQLLLFYLLFRFNQSQG